MKFTVLGSGTSTGVPLVGCGCQICSSADAKDKRRRASMLIQDDFSVIIDTGPDFREQMLEHSIKHIDAVLYTHYHYDHTGGLDDLRPYSFFSGSAIPCFVDSDTQKIFHEKYPYVKETANKEKNIPLIRFQEYKKAANGRYQSFNIKNLEIQPLRLIHEPDNNVISVGFVFNQKIAYLTDFKSIHEEDRKFLYDLEVLYTGAPLMRQHSKHLSIPEAILLMQQFKPKRGFIGHLSHNKSHSDLLDFLPKGIKPAFDSMTIEF